MLLCDTLYTRIISLFLLICRDTISSKSLTVKKKLGGIFHELRSKYDIRRSNYSNNRSRDARWCVKRCDFILETATLYNFARARAICIVGVAFLRAIIVAASSEKHLRNEHEDVAKEAEICRRRTRHKRVKRESYHHRKLTNHPFDRREKNADVVIKDFQPRRFDNLFQSLPFLYHLSLSSLLSLL